MVKNVLFRFIKSFKLQYEIAKWNVDWTIGYLMEMRWNINSSSSAGRNKKIL